MNRRHHLAAALLAVSALVPLAAPAGAANPPSIENIVVVLEQNHTFDSYFGNYPGARGYGEVTKWPTDATGQEVRPFLATVDALRPFQPKIGEEALGNGAAIARASMAGGSMDGIVRAQEGEGYPGTLAMATHDRSTSGVLWDLADQYVLFDNYFSSHPGGSLPNMLELFAGTDLGIEESTRAALAEVAEVAPPTIFDQLAQTDIGWGFYSDHVTEIDPEAVLRRQYLQDDATAPSALYWAPFLAIPRTWQSSRDHLRTQPAFYADAARGDLPALSVVLPTPTDQPLAPATGIDRLQSIVNALKKGPQWDHTAVLVVWDDWGGFYDHVVPPAGKGSRVPMLLVSPLAKQGHVSSTLLDHDSVRRFILGTFGAAGSGSADAGVLDDGFADPDTQPARRNALLTGHALPDAPVGTPQENSRTLRLYLAGLVVSAILLLVGLRSVAPRQTPTQPKTSRST